MRIHQAILFIFLMLTGMACRAPKLIHAEVEANYSLPWDFFPVSSESDRQRIWSLVEATSSDDRAHSATQVPIWMIGEWKILGSESFGSLVVKPGFLRLRDKAENEDERRLMDGDYPLKISDQLRIDMSENFLIRVDERNGLMVISGPKGLSCGGGIYAGRFDRVNARTSLGRKELVEQWTFSNRGAGYGFGLSKGENENWTLVRIESLKAESRSN